MKSGYVSFRWFALLALACLLPLLSGQADPSPTPAPHKKKHRSAASADDGSATPSPSPASSRSKHHATHHAADDEAEQPLPAASPAGKSEGESHRAGEDHATADNNSAKASGSDGKSAAAADEPKISSAAKAEGTPSASPAPSPAATSTIDVSDLRDFDAQPAPVRGLLSAALDLTRRNLTYTYGSADPANGGMDCSGTIYYLLKAAGFDDVPRSASEQYAWVRRQSRFYAVLSKKEDSFELKEMRPGDLLFWTGTYHIERDPPVTHTMLYLGRRQKDGKPLMFGASDGRPYDGQRRNGVSVFDFRMPAAPSADSVDASTAAAPDHSPDFAGYGPIPGLAERNDAASRQAAAEGSPSKVHPADH